jgi:hypothetical protein
MLSRYWKKKKIPVTGQHIILGHTTLKILILIQNQSIYRLELSFFVFGNASSICKREVFIQLLLFANFSLSLLFSKQNLPFLFFRQKV